MKIIIMTLAPLFAGLLFSIGLLISGMTSPAKVQGFLDIAGVWDPSLSFVMGGAIAVMMPVFQWGQRRAALPVVHRPVEGSLLLGSLLFGIGWGVSGYCPGPALVMAGAGAVDALLYVAAMILGMLAAERFGLHRHAD